MPNVENKIGMIEGNSMSEINDKIEDLNLRLNWTVKQVIENSVHCDRPGELTIRMFVLLEREI